MFEEFFDFLKPLMKCQPTEQPNNKNITNVYNLNTQQKLLEKLEIIMAMSNTE